MMKSTKGLSTVLSNLQNVKRSIPQNAIAELRKGATQIQKSAQQFAPLDKGPLESSIKIDEQVTPERASITIYVDESTPTDRHGVAVGDYAMALHEGSYNLGPHSRAKAASLGVQVGPKYLERALRAHRPDIAAALNAAIKKALNQ
jgi:hypothetical protein